MATPSASSATPSSPSVYLGLINSPATQVTDSIDGFLLANPHCRKLAGGRECKVVLRADWNASKAESTVSLISGGGDGHAPAHAGFVGAGMLTAAVSGEVFASPSVSAVFAAIRSVARPASSADAAAASAASAPVPAKGTLLIVKNYTGDRLNFGLALSQSLLDSASMKAEMVVVGDDVALPRSKGVTGRRGVAGTVLVHKIAGYAAEQGMDLESVRQRAAEAAQSLVSLGVSTSSCHVPGSLSSPLDSPRPAPGFVELGMGIHNEAGMNVEPLVPARDIVERMVGVMLSRDGERDYFWRDSSPREAKGGEEVVLLVNNLGASTAAEMNVFALEALRALRAAPYAFVVRRLLVGAFMTALDMKGISLSILRLSADPARREWQLQALDAPTNASGWPVGCVVTDPVEPAPVPMPIAPAAVVGSAGSNASVASASPVSPSVLPAILASFVSTIRASAAKLNALDARSGDGDCGTTLAIGAEALHGLLETNALNFASPAGTLAVLARALGEKMGGSSGAILQILLTAAAANLQSQTVGSPSAVSFARALSAGITSVSRFGGAVEGDRTMLDALAPAVRTFQLQLEGESGAEGSPKQLYAAVQAAAGAARKGADGTRGMVGRAGRSNYVTGDALAEQDPGAEAVALLWAAASEAIGK